MCRSEHQVCNNLFQRQREIRITSSGLLSRRHLSLDIRAEKFPGAKGIGGVFFLDISISISLKLVGLKVGFSASKPRHPASALHLCQAVITVIKSIPK